MRWRVVSRGNAWQFGGADGRATQSGPRHGVGLLAGRRSRISDAVGRPRFSAGTTALIARCAPWVGAAMAPCLSKPTRNTKCVWTTSRPKSSACTTRGNASSLWWEAPARQVPAPTTPRRSCRSACKEHGIWFHVTAHGASAAFSDAHRHLVKGIEHADSVVLDFHKTCGIPALCTGVFYARHAESFCLSPSTPNTSGTTPTTSIGGTPANAPLNARSGC